MAADTAKTGAVPTGRNQSGDWALRYALLGWSVVPVHTIDDGRCTCADDGCRSPGKHPRIRWEQAMSEPASPDCVSEWWHRWPEANVGVATGPVSSVAVIDVDPRSGGDASLRRLEARWGMLSVTPEVHTGGGGSHLWFRSEVGVPSATLGPGVELKAEGGMVVVPPSVHASGIHYRWRPAGDPDALSLAPLPGWVADLARKGHAGATGQEAEPPLRTSIEQAEFADAWARVGIDLLPGDRYYLCPFHDDHHPSLHIDAGGCRWYCFGCGTGGGVGRLLGTLGEHYEPRALPQLRRRQARGLPVTLHGSHKVEVVGESHHQNELLSLTGGRRRYGGVKVELVAELVPEPTNRFDPNAVAVSIEDRRVGYLRREHVEWLGPLVDESLDLHGLATCRAMIRGGWDRGRDQVGWFGVTLLLPDHPE